MMTLNFDLRICILILVVATAAAKSKQSSNKATSIDNRFLNHLFQNETSESYARKLNEFHIKLIKLANSDCLIRTQGTVDDAFINYTEFGDNSRNLWIKYFQHNYKNKNEENDLIERLTQTCFNVSQLANIASFYEFDEFENAEYILEFILLQYYKQGCNLCKTGNGTNDGIKRIEIWLYSTLFVTLINIASLSPAIIIPFVTKRFYRHALMVLIALAIGILCGSGFCNLIPRSYGLAQNIYHRMHRQYIYKGVVIMAAIYGFYLIEKIIKILVANKQTKKHKTTDDENNLEFLENLSHVKINEIEPELDVKIRVKHTKKMMLKQKRDRPIASVAWIVVVSDFLHKFIDGLTIGAAFSESVTNGIHLSTAVVFEEIPHQLGDFAILIHAGMYYRTALLFQMISAIWCYTGLLVGIFIGKLLKAAPWIYAMTGGVFIYIALVDMIPELNELTDEIEKSYAKKCCKNCKRQSVKHQLKIFFIQNLAIIIGFGVMLILAILTNR